MGLKTTLARTPEDVHELLLYVWKNYGEGTSGDIDGIITTLLWLTDDAAAHPLADYEYL